MKYPKQEYRRDVDGLRGIAILAVLMFHGFPDLAPGGFIGVDVFFVISGFLITSIIKSNIRRENFSLLHFYLGRVRRLFPSLIIMMSGCFICGWFLLDFGDYKLLGKHITSTATFTSNLIFLSESGYFDQTAISKPLLHIWSLSLEEQFYLFWPILLLLLSSFNIRATYVLLLVLITSFLLNIFFSFRNEDFAYFFPLNRFWELALGALLNYVPRQTSAKYSGLVNDNAAGLIGFAAIIVSCLLLNKSLAFPGWWALIPTLGTALIIYSNGPKTTINKILTSRALVSLGLISYPLYLFHWPLLSFWKIVTLKTPDGTIATAIILAAIGLATVVYLFFERPIRKKGNIKTSLFLMLLMFIIGCIGFNLYQRDGYPFRPVAEAALKSNIRSMARLPDRVSCRITENNLGDCVNDLADRSQPLVFFWGDSTVANATDGMTRARLEALNIQTTVSMRGACPPFINYVAKASTRRECENFLSHGLSVIDKYKPEVVILFANWQGYFLETQSFSKLDPTHILDTIKKIRGLGARKIILMGQFPVFEASQTDVGRRVFIRNSVTHTKFLLKQEALAVDELVRNFAMKNNITFISPIDLLCNSLGCQISASDQEYLPMGYDSLHMTPPGAKVFFEKAFSPDSFTVIN
jgi:peptidoglycan/LPS O-acetylase OafA/YrhL